MSFLNILLFFLYYCCSQKLSELVRVTMLQGFSFVVFYTSSLLIMVTLQRNDDYIYFIFIQIMALINNDYVKICQIIFTPLLLLTQSKTQSPFYKAFYDPTLITFQTLSSIPSLFCEIYPATQPSQHVIASSLIYVLSLALSLSRI